MPNRCVAIYEQSYNNYHFLHEDESWQMFTTKYILAYKIHIWMGGRVNGNEDLKN